MKVTRLRKAPAKYRGRTKHARTLPYQKRLLQILATTLIGIMVFCGTAFGLIYNDLNKQIKTVAGTEKLLKRTPSPVDSFDGRPLNILLIGSDSRVGEGNDEYAYQKDSTQRSDTTMLAHISADRSRVQVVSFPRDALVDIPSCTRSDGTVIKPHPSTQFNWAYSLGSGTEGDQAGALACTWKTVENLTGLRIDEAVIVDFNGFQHMINALGGIKVYVESPIHDAKNSGVVIPEAGCKHFDGKEALGYARVRMGIKGGDGSDEQRILRQQEVIGIMLKTALKKNILTDIPSLYAFLRSGLSAISTSDGLSDSSKIAGLGWSLRSLKPDHVTFITMPWVEDKFQRYRLREDKKLSYPIWDRLRKDQPFPDGTHVRDASGYTYKTGDPTADPLVMNTKTETENTPKAEDPKASDRPATTKPAEETKPKQSGRKAATSHKVDTDPEELARLREQCQP